MTYLSTYSPANVPRLVVKNVKGTDRVRCMEARALTDPTL